MLWLLSLAVVVAIVLAAYLGRERLRRSLATEGMAGRRLYSDASGKGAILKCERLGLKGKPDYVMEEDGELVVVERKSRVMSKRPFEGELLQLAACCILVEERFGREVKVGRLQYPNKTITIPFTSDLRQRMLAGLEAIREAEMAEQVHRSHRNPRACARCGFRSRCGEALV